MVISVPRLALAIALGLAMTAPASAQERKKSSERERSQQERTSRPSYSGGNSCIGGMFLIRDGESVSCSLPDGRTCTVTAGTSGKAILSNCK